MTEETITHPCAVCLAMDRADGVEDGWLVPPLHHRVKNANKLVNSLKRTQDRAADAVTSFAGSLNFVYLHSIWFGIWILLNIGLVGAAVEFDRYPFGLLTMIVSLEAIFLSTFVMVSQNRQAMRTEVRSQLDFEANLRSELWAMHIGQTLGIHPDHVETVVAKVIAQANHDQNGP
ncbi:MAG: hypothetical protein QOI74_4080 [Micromonosporaceae bacterium]|jgi:uncharacterized membrane protein|nr:hypothetical protein [Micromonosporaceae bacterium]